MEFTLPLILAAIGLALLLEGCPYFLWAEKMPKYLRMMAEQSPGSLRMVGLLAMLIGLGLLFLARSL
jgi:hypothetical protein